VNQRRVRFLGIKVKNILKSVIKNTMHGKKMVLDITHYILGLKENLVNLLNVVIAGKLVMGIKCTGQIKTINTEES